MKYRGYGVDHSDYMQRQQEIYLKALALKPKVTTPKTSYAFVIKILASRVNMRVGGYAVVTPSDLFSLATSLEYATLFPTFDAAFEAIERRNYARPDTSERYAVAKVKVVETPAVAAQLKQVTAPGKHGFVLQAAGDSIYAERYVREFGSAFATYTYEQDQAHVFPTAVDAATWLDARRTSSFAGYGMTFTIIPVSTPSTSTTQTIREAQPVSTVVTLA